MRLKGGLVGPLFALLAIAALLGLRRLDVVEVRGRSMLPTLHPGDRLVVVRGRAARAGEVALARDPRDPRRELVKRVVSADGLGVGLRGDNFVASTDERAFGRVPAEAVRWRAVFRYWPVGRVGRIPPAPFWAEEGGEDACTFPDALIAG